MCCSTSMWCCKKCAEWAVSRTLLMLCRQDQTGKVSQGERADRKAGSSRRGSHDQGGQTLRRYFWQFLCSLASSWPCKDPSLCSFEASCPAGKLLKAVWSHGILWQDWLTGRTVQHVRHARRAQITITACSSGAQLHGDKEVCVSGPADFAWHCQHNVSGVCHVSCHHNGATTERCYPAAWTQQATFEGCVYTPGCVRLNKSCGNPSDHPHHLCVKSASKLAGHSGCGHADAAGNKYVDQL